MKRTMAMAVAVWMAVLVAAQAWQWGALSVPEMAAHGGATHVAIFKYSDFTMATTNTAQTFTNGVAARTGVECMGMVLDAAFDVGTTNYTGSCLLKVGDGSDDDLFLTSTELASDGTEVFVKYGPPNSVAVTAGLQTNTVVSAVAFTLVTNTVEVAGWTTGTVVYASAVTPTSGSLTSAVSVTSAATVSELNRKLYTAAGNIVYTFTPNLNEALDDNTAGEVRVYFRLIQWPR
jgi:hypothetical protein